MKILILGGTVFLGHHLVEASLRRGHTVSIFTRGQHDVTFSGEVERLVGDRLGDVSALGGGRWDAAIDCSGYVPQAVKATATLLAGAVAHYTFISSASVYDQENQPGPHAEDAPVVALSPDIDADTLVASTPETYGALKVLCEQAAHQAMPGRVLVVRPGAIVGPEDVKDRLTFWVRRIAHGGPVLLPGTPADRIAFTDGRDLADWVIARCEARTTGTFNVAGLQTTMQALFDACRTASSSNATPVWVDEAFIKQQGIAPWTELPLWGPTAVAQSIATADEQARAQGMTYRPLAQTVHDTLDWDTSRTGSPALRAGLSAQHEAEHLVAFHAAVG
jgi:2'-hydroxyisoflavone reductase